MKLINVNLVFRLESIKYLKNSCKILINNIA